MADRPAIVVYVTGWLASLGSRGWRETPESDPAHGALEMVNDTGDIVAYTFRFNSGSPRWFLARCPPALLSRMDDRIPDGTRR